ncbi:HNH endonuclease [Thioalkalivibrio sp. ALgr3]|uniref:HNH endonuclease n=1 Tax=Thioalkalivibrio sp. ALgr3 TaxID=1239292 RepID=UPI0018CBB3BD|nr:HNH endonuclease [Thioalkalivibrio sp. ALgr3]
MPVNFDNLVVGKEYERPELADLWGYKGYQAISRGVVTPSDSNVIILFVTKEKQQALTQYVDYIDGDRLYWEGEAKHSNDDRIIHARDRGEQIHLFYREVHHSPFVYYGEIHLLSYELHTDVPSRFVFSLAGGEEPLDPITEIEQHSDEYASLNETDKDAVIKSRLGQGRFRDRVIDLWQSCSVTGLGEVSLLRASHIKPWRSCTNEERLDAMNGLLLTPALDHLFDKGFITFGDDGKIQFSDRLSDDCLRILCVDKSARLRKVPAQMKEFLRFHRQHVFH